MPCRLLMLALVTGLAITSCQRAAPPAAPAPQAPLTITYPYDEAVFPPELAAPTIRWTDSGGATLWTLDFTLPDGRVLSREAAGTTFRPDPALWTDLKAASRDRPLTLTIRPASAPAATATAASVRFSTSSDPVGDSLFFREVVLPFRLALQDTRAIQWRFGDLASDGPPPVVLSGVPVCANCHSFSADGRVLGMDVDFANDKGSYAMLETGPQMALSPDRVLSWKALDSADATKTFGLLPRVSPDGRFVLATVRDRSVFVAVDDNLAYSQLFFPVKGVLGWYDRQSQRFGTLPGADDPALVQSNPAWSPDGTQLTFARAPRFDLGSLKNPAAVILTPEDCPEFFGGGQKLRYDLYQIPFNGGAGGRPVPVPGASNNGKSNFFPRYSPDGKWLVFTQADSFMLLQADANLFILPAAGGTPRKLRANRASMNSWHSWSSNSRWLVFSSKVNGPYTQLFLTHIDAQGNDSPPVLLEHFTAPDRAANIPEFVALPPGAIQQITPSFLGGDSYYQAASAALALAPKEAQATGLQKAADLFATSVKLDPENADVRLEYALVLVSLGRVEEAVEQLNEAIRLRPEDPNPYYNLGLLHERAGRPEDADTLYLRASVLDPTLVEARLALLLLRAKKGQVAEAMVELETILELRPDWYPALFHLGRLLMEEGRMDQAALLFQRAVDADPKVAEAHWRLGVARLAAGQSGEASTGLEAALKLFPGDANLLDLRAIVLADLGDFPGAQALATSALEAARAKGNAPLSAAIQAHLNDLRAQKVPGL